jgi:hypothetical protein
MPYTNCIWLRVLNARLDLGFRANLGHRGSLQRSPRGTLEPSALARRRRITSVPPHQGRVSGPLAFRGNEFVPVQVAPALRSLPQWGGGTVENVRDGAPVGAGETRVGKTPGRLESRRARARPDAQMGGRRMKLTSATHLCRSQWRLGPRGTRYQRPVLAETRLTRNVTIGETSTSGCARRVTRIERSRLGSLQPSERIRLPTGRPEGRLSPAGRCDASWSGAQDVGTCPRGPPRVFRLARRTVKAVRKLWGRRLPPCAVE